MRRSAAVALAVALVCGVLGTAFIGYSIGNRTSDEMCMNRLLEVRLAGPRAAWVEPYPEVSQWLRARHFDEKKNGDWMDDWPDDWKDEDGVITHIFIDGKTDRVYLGEDVADGEPWRVNLRECRDSNTVSYWLEDR